VDHSLGIRNLWASWNFLYRDRVGYYTVSATNSLQNYSDFWLTDLRLSYKKQRFVVYAEATNLFDHRYADLGELIQPGRWFKAGVQVEFGF
jgi:iron complex outermembrane receptor protein